MPKPGPSAVAIGRSAAELAPAARTSRPRSERRWISSDLPEVRPRRRRYPADWVVTAGSVENAATSSAVVAPTPTAGRRWQSASAAPTERAAHHRDRNQHRVAAGPAGGLRPAERGPSPSTVQPAGARNGEPRRGIANGRGAWRATRWAWAPPTGSATGVAAGPLDTRSARLAEQVDARWRRWRSRRDCRRDPEDRWACGSLPWKRHAGPPGSPIRPGRRRRRGRGRVTTGRSVAKPVRRGSVRCRVAGSCRSTFPDRGPSVRLEGGAHGAMGVMES